MKILIVNTYDRGGAANACLRLHQGLLHQGLNSKVLLKVCRKNIPQTFSFNSAETSVSTTERLRSKIFTGLRLLGFLKKNPNNINAEFQKNRKRGLELFSFPESPIDITKSPLYQEADIINLHWVANFLDFESFFIKNTKPVVWTLHDMNPFTGGEHYSEMFLGMDERGYPISRSITQEEQLVYDYNLTLKQNALSQVENLTIVSPSRWLADKAKNSSLFSKFQVKHIPYGLNSEIFRPRDRTFSRDLFQIPKDKKVILFVADSISNNRKGYAYLKKALEMLERTDVILCAVGSKQNTLELNHNIVELGAIVDERLMSMVYSAADVFVIPSLMDNLPNTVLESLMCGTPIIGFPIGGIPEMVASGVNGLLTDSINSHALFKSLNLFFDSFENFDRDYIRKIALSKYNSDIQATKYRDLFHKVLKN